jgi:hypothetical protein
VAAGGREREREGLRCGSWWAERERERRYCVSQVPDSRAGALLAHPRAGGRCGDERRRAFASHWTRTSNSSASLSPTWPAACSQTRTPHCGCGCYRRERPPKHALPAVPPVKRSRLACGEANPAMLV